MSAGPAAPVVGFDLDMTLVDSARGIGATMAALAEVAGEPRLADPALLGVLLRSTIEVELERLVGPERTPELLERYRDLYIAHGVPATTAMPGAAAALDAVRALGGRVLVVTAKFADNAHRCLAAAGLEADEVVGGLWGEEKAGALRAHGARLYVGDTVADVRAALAAGVTPVLVTSGPDDAATLRAAGAEVVLASLEELPPVLPELLAGAAALEG